MLSAKLALAGKKTFGYRERDEAARQAFQARLNTKHPDQLHFVDEAGMDDRDEYPYGYAPIGERIAALKSGKQNERISWIAALQEDHLLAPLTFTGSCNRDLVEAWLANLLLPQLKPGDVIVMDNASFHHSPRIRKLVEDAGCELWYLPTYSPDLNDIEHWWFGIKNWIRQRKDEFDGFRDCVDAAFRESPNVRA
jgi:transposase